MIRILSLDDEPEMADLIGLILGRKGYELVVCSDSYEAWALSHAQPFDLFTQDLARPDVDGWEFYQAIRSDASLRDLPVIILSARAQEETKSLLMEAGADAYITKPFGPQELLAAVEYVLRKHGKSPPVEGELSHLRDRQAVGDGTSSQQDVPGLIQALRDDAWPRRCTAAITLGHAKDAQAVEPLIQALQDKVSYVRMIAALALGKLGDGRAVEPLLPVLADEDSWVRQVVARTLGQIADPRAVEALVGALHDQVPNVCRKAAYALTRIGELTSETLIESMREDSAQVREAVASVLWRVKGKRDRVVEALVAALQDEDAGVRRAAIWSLYHTGDKRAAESLVAVLQDEDVDVVQNAIHVLQWIGDARTIPHLQRVAREDTRKTCYGGAIADIARSAIERIQAAQK